MDNCLIAWGPQHSQVKVEVSAKHGDANLKIIKNDGSTHNYSNYFLTFYSGWLRVKHNNTYRWYATEDIRELIEENPEAPEKIYDRSTHTIKGC